MPRIYQLLALIVILLAIASCQRQSAAACSPPEGLDEVGPALAACLAPEAGAAEAQLLLLEWRRLDQEWNGVRAADLTAAPGDELALTFFQSLLPADILEEESYLLVLEQKDGDWHIAYENQGALRAGSRHARWLYRPGEPLDITGDGLAELPLELHAHNGLRTLERRLVLLSAHEDDSLRPLYNERLEGDYRLAAGGDGARLELIAQVNSLPAITRTLTFDGGAFVQTGLAINPAAATTSASLPDGSTWYGFDAVGVIGRPANANGPFGLYREEDGRLEHLPLDAPVAALAPGPEGDLYVAAGDRVLRLEGGESQLPASLGAPGESLSGPLSDISFARDGTVWVGGPFTLARYDGAWTTYPINARRLLVTEEGDVWAEGWNGRADSSCCFTHVEGERWTTYTHDAPLPLPPSLEAAVRRLLPQAEVE